ncbi:MAG: hypothetical protein ACRDFB_05980 [Rhabdochlamydiaceae bacterium]
MALRGVSQTMINVSLLQELCQRSDEKDNPEAVLQPSSQKEHVEVIEDSQGQPFRFQLCWKLKDGRTLLAPFWADVSLGKWCFRNGNPHSFYHLSDMIAELLRHLSEGEVMTSNSTQ